MLEHSAAILAHTAHRRDPLPQRPWIGRQSWYNLLLAHWRASPEAVQAMLPPGLLVDTFAGEAWIGVVAYQMAHVRLRYMPSWSATSFPQLNLRTYVTYKGRAGIYFFSLDAASALAVKTGRLITGLPYFLAKMSMTEKEGRFHFASSRNKDGRGFCADYQALPSFSQENDCDLFLTERYVFYAQQKDGRLTAGDVCHRPWTLQSAQATIHSNSLKDRFGLSLADVPDRLQFAAGLDVLFWRPVTIAKISLHRPRLTMLR